MPEAVERGSTATVELEQPATVTQVETTGVTPNRSSVYRFIKRTFDIVASLAGLIILSPVLLITAVAIYIDDPGPVLFFQDRDGLNGKIFKMWKFRSMYQNAPELRAKMGTQNELDGPAFKMKNDPRITRVGKFLRRFSIDELPQLVNILFGEMSVVGPRPLPKYETAQLTPEQRQRLLVKPGLTCYWQISGRNTATFEEWMEYDFRYIREQSLWTDCKLVLATIPAVFSGGGVLKRQSIVRYCAHKVITSCCPGISGQHSMKGVMPARRRLRFQTGFKIRGDPYRQRRVA